MIQQLTTKVNQLEKGNQKGDDKSAKVVRDSMNRTTTEVDMVQHHNTEVIGREVEGEVSNTIDDHSAMTTTMMVTMMTTMMTSTTTNPVRYATDADKRDTWPLDVVSSWTIDGSHLNYGRPASRGRR